jgi:membrane-bound lytic murein transglycosylase A
MVATVVFLTAGVAAAAASDGLPPFEGDGRDVSRPMLSTTFTHVQTVPGEQLPDRDSLDAVLTIQALIAAKLPAEQTLLFDGVRRPIVGKDMVRVVGLLQQWQASGKPLSDYLDGYLLKGDDQGNVRFTSYFSPSIRVSATQGAGYQVPLYRKPPEQIDQFPSRKEIYSGALAGRGLELAWAASMADLYFLEVQGSGYGVYPDGSRRLFSFGGKNGHSYVSIGKHLVEQGQIKAEAISMAAIKAWFAANPGKARDVMELNPSYVFFVTDKMAVTGAAGRAVTAMRTVAADSSVLPLGSMLVIEMPILDAQGRVAFYQPRIMAVQDRGGAIKGTGRIDIYAGAGPAAEEMAGNLKHFGRVWLLLPKSQ